MLLFAVAPERLADAQAKDAAELGSAGLFAGYWLGSGIDAP